MRARHQNEIKKTKKNKLKINKITLVVLILLQISYVTVIPINAASREVAAQDHEPILFLHGYTKTAKDWTTMKEWFIDDGWSETILYAKTFDDFNNCTTATNIDNANKIKEWVTDILDQNGVDKVDLVGHSMGGLSSRYYIKFLGGIDTVDDYVSIGSPHHGDKGLTGCMYGPYGDLKKPDGLLSMLNEGDETPGGILDDTKEEDHIPGNISYTSIYSDSDEHVASSDSKLDGANNTMVKDLRHTPLLFNETVYELVRFAVSGMISKESNIGYDWTIMPTVVLVFSLLAIKKRRNK